MAAAKGGIMEMEGDNAMNKAEYKIGNATFYVERRYVGTSGPEKIIEEMVTSAITEKRCLCPPGPPMLE